ncbi:hypothetical protein [Pandoraea vervacti]|nr:hypothetical protein [Pandoraea vervacti]
MYELISLLTRGQPDSGRRGPSAIGMTNVARVGNEAPGGPSGLVSDLRNVRQAGASSALSLNDVGASRWNGVESTPGWVRTFGPAFSPIASPGGLQPVTAELICMLMVMGAEQVRLSGGLEAIAANHRVSFEALRAHVDENADPTERGTRLLAAFTDSVESQSSEGALSDSLTTSPSEIIGAADVTTGRTHANLPHQERADVRVSNASCNASHFTAPETSGRDDAVVRTGPAGALAAPLRGRGVVAFLQAALEAPAGTLDVEQQAALAARFHVSYKTVKRYLRVDGTLSVTGQIKLGPGSVATAGRMSADILRTLLALGPRRISEAGGRKAIARIFNISPLTLNHWLEANGQLTPRAYARLIASAKPRRAIDADLLHQIHAHIRQSGGARVDLRTLADAYGVPFTSLRQYVNDDGNLSSRAKCMLREKAFPPRNLVTEDILGEIQALGRTGIRSAGGLTGLAERYDVAYGSLKSFIRADGTLTPSGEYRLGVVSAHDAPHASPAAERAAKQRWRHRLRTWLSRDIEQPR